MCSTTLFGRSLRAMILDLDGVITRTASVHARAWKSMFDEYLSQRAARVGEQFVAFSVEGDYLKYVDGKPRYEGTQSFLQSRGIELPWGDPSDEPGRETVCGLGNRKNALFHQLLEKDGAEVFGDAVAALRRWREQGVKLALVSSSQNCQRIVEVAGIGELFDTSIDGVEAEREQLPGKPQPDVFLRAAEKLGVRPEEAAVFEDSVAGVQAGRRGGFALVVGVARSGEPGRLQQGGADRVVGSFDELAEAPKRLSRPPSALENLESLQPRWAGKRLALFLDYDGTLTPIVARPEDAVMEDGMRRTVRRLAELTRVAVISGRDRADVESLVDLPQLIYAGSHGFDIRGPDLRREHEEGRAALPELDDAETTLKQELADIRGAQVERKRFAVAIHYRNVGEREVEPVRQAVERCAARHPKLRLRGGKKIFELQPDIDWHKGKAVSWLLEVGGGDAADVVPMYVGDDVTDEDAFVVLEHRGIGIVVGDDTLPSHAHYWLADTDEVQRFLAALIPTLERRSV